MEKKLVIMLEGDKLTLDPSEGITNTDVIVMAINMLEIAKSNMEKDLNATKTPSIEEFISIMLKSLRKTNE